MASIVTARSAGFGGVVNVVDMISYVKIARVFTTEIQN